MNKITIKVKRYIEEEKEIDSCWDCDSKLGGFIEGGPDGTTRGGTNCIITEEYIPYPFKIPDNCPRLKK
jgi:hypothetical protein